MSVQPGPTFKRYAANGVATVYTIPFLLLDTADLQIKLNGVLITTGFTLSGIGNPTSSCTFSVAPAGDLLFQQQMAFQRLTDYQMNGDFQSPTVNRDYDRLWLAVKQLNRDSGRALTANALEPEGIPPIPLKTARGSKMLGFNVEGNPVVSSLTIDQIEQQPALALESAAAAKASADNAEAAASSASGSASSANASKNAAAGSASAAASSAQAATDAGLQLGMSAWGYRLQPFAGFALDDGQELERALYPDFAAAIDSGLWPRVTEAQWQADPSVRGCYVANSSPGKFRMRDLNGMSPGSIGAAFLRGGGSSGNGVIRRDQMQTHKHPTTQESQPSVAGSPWATVEGNTTSVTYAQSLAASSAVNNVPRALSGVPFTLTTQWGEAARIGTETFPTHATGAWMTRLYGLITPLGSAEASSLATAYASMASRISVLEAVPRIRRWRSSNLALSSTPQAFAHGLGVVPDIIEVHLTLIAGMHGWPPGATFRQPAGNLDYSGSSGAFGHQIASVSDLGFTMSVAQNSPIILATNGVAQSVATPSQVTIQVSMMAWV